MKVITVEKDLRRESGVVKAKSATPNNTSRHPSVRTGSAIRGKTFTIVEIANPSKVTEIAKKSEAREARNEALQTILIGKRQEVLRELQDNVNQYFIQDQQRYSDSVGDVGDQALMNRERERSLVLMEMRNRKRQALDEALIRLREGSYGICQECGVDINDKRLQAVPFAKLCVECQSRAELLEQIEQAEEREDQ